MLKTGESATIISYNIRKERESGVPRRQAIAIALNKARSRKRKKGRMHNA